MKIFFAYFPPSVILCFVFNSEKRTYNILYTTSFSSLLQVKNFGRSGRTKYTHLVDQDTTDYDSSWAQPSQAAVNFQNKFGGGLKQVFVKPTAKKRKIE